MSVSDGSPQIDIDSNSRYFFRWTVEKYHAEVEWDTVHDRFAETASLVRSLVEACVEERALGSTEFKAICHAANSHLTQSKLREYISEFNVDEEIREALVESVPESFGVVGGPLMQISVSTSEAEEQLLAAFEDLVNEASSQEKLLAAVDKIAAAETEGVKAGRLTPVLCLLWPGIFPINNGRTRDVLNKFFGLSITDSLTDYREEIPLYIAVRDEFGFRSHFRDLDRYCHWALEGEGSEVSEWVSEHSISDRSVWQINAGVSNDGEPDKLWPVWQEYGLCSIGWDSTDLSSLSDEELESCAGEWGDAVVDYYKRFAQEMQPGELIIAKDGYDLLGIGVTKQGGYQYCGDFIETESGVHHPHVWPVEWVVIPDGEQRTRDWELETNLQSRTTLMRTKAFEQIRLELASRQPGLLSKLGELERLVSSPPAADIPGSCAQTGKGRSEWTPSDEFDPERSFYWVNQSYDEELNGEFLRSRDTKWQRDLTVLEPGDVVFHYTNQALRACSVVERTAYQQEYDGEQHYFVDLDTEWLDNAIPLSEVVDVLGLPDIKQGQSRYPIDKNGGVIQAYLCYLSPAAAEFLLDTIDATIPKGGDRYFWVNTKQTSWQEPGGQLFYSTTRSSGKEWRNQEAFERVQPGDDVLVYQLDPEKRVVGRARVVDGLHERDRGGDEGSESGITLEWVESVDGASWERVASDPELADCRVVESNKSYVLTEITEEEFERVLELGELVTYEEFSDDLTIASEDISVERGNLYFSDEEWDRIQSRVRQALAAGNHVLLFGPPGTGKTKLARNVCAATVGDDRFELVTASADWSTFDTVGGYQTTAANTLEFKPGVVLDRFQSDDDGTPANEWLIIDELNRADIDKAFGSLFSALTGESVTLPFDDTDGEPIEILDASRSDAEIRPNRYFIPDDWQMLATINTLDKTSLYEMSYAFMRRWAFIPVGIPDLPAREDGDDSELESLVADYVAVWAADGSVPEADQHYETVGRIWRAVNTHRAIGPAIVEDIYEHVAAAPSTEAADYVSPIIMYVFPQLEGLRRNELEQLIGALDEIVADETGELWTVARDFFQIDLQPGGGE